MKMRGIRLRFLGKANVYWEEMPVDDSVDNELEKYSSNESYFDFVIVLFGKADGESGPNPILPAGRYVYPFTCQLPPNLPSSFEGAHGRVRYWLDGVIDRPWRFDEHTKKAFSILGVLDLNIQPHIRNPQSGSQYKKISCLCFESGPILANFRIDRRGYVPGECLILNGEVENQSNRTMSHTKVVLRMYTTFRSTTKSRTRFITVAQLVKGQLAEGQTVIWTGERLHIPPLPPSSLVHCNIIDIVYHVILIVQPSGREVNIEVPLEIVVGTIPLYNIESYFSTKAYSSPHPYNPNRGRHPNAPIDTQPGPSALPAPPSVPSQLSNIPPQPSFAEYAMGRGDMRDKGDSEYTRGDKEWAPVYTYYSWGQQPSAPPPNQ